MSSPGCLSSLHSPAAPWATHFGAGLVLSWPPLGISSVSSHVCSQFPVLLSQAGGGPAGRQRLPERRLTWPGDRRRGCQGGSSQDTGQEEEPCLPLLRETEGFPDGHEVTVASQCELDGRKEKLTFSCPLQGGSHRELPSPSPLGPPRGWSCAIPKLLAGRMF